MPASQFDTVQITPSQVDSLKLMMAVSLNNIVGDSVVPMGLDVYKLTRLLPSPIYSDFNPADYYDPTPHRILYLQPLGCIGRHNHLGQRTIYRNKTSR